MLDTDKEETSSRRRQDRPRQFYQPPLDDYDQDSSSSDSSRFAVISRPGRKLRMSCMISEISPISGGRLTSTLNASIQQLELREPPMTLTNGTMLMVTYENDGQETGPDDFGDPDGEGQRELVPSAEAEPAGHLPRPLLTGPDEGEEQESDVKDLGSFRAGAVEGERDLFDLLWALEAQVRPESHHERAAEITFGDTDCSPLLAGHPDATASILPPGEGAEQPVGGGGGGGGLTTAAGQRGGRQADGGPHDAQRGAGEGEVKGGELPQVDE